ncbi:MAG: FMN-binding protein [Sphaerochaetaceae bacterium]|nr:FMN-binding protein [Sphaerochaetaceae bacterium]
MKTRFIVLIVIVLAIGILAVTVSLLLRTTEKKLEALTAIEIEDVDLLQVPDGTYEGEWKVFPINVVVRVSVTDHEITEVLLMKHDNGQGEAAEELLDEIVHAQRINLDAVSGASYSSKAILLAVRDALVQ